MSVIIRAHCPTCDGVDLSPDQVRLTSDTYTFTCPVCLLPVTKPADKHRAALLTSAGVIMRDTAPAITFDDVLDFILGDLNMRELVA